MMHFRWTGRYLGPGKMYFAIPSTNFVSIFTDHSLLTFKFDGTPCESILLDKPMVDAGKNYIEVLV